MAFFSRKNKGRTLLFRTLPASNRKRPYFLRKKCLFSDTSNIEITLFYGNLRVYMPNFFKGRLVFVRTILLLSTLAIVAWGIITIYAVGHPAESGNFRDTEGLSNYWKKQAIFAIVGFAAFLIVNMFSYRRFGSASFLIYAFVIFLLALLLVDKYLFNIPDFLIEETRNIHAWIKIPFTGLNIQPSEICKPAYVIALAWYLRYRSNYRKFSALIGPFIFTFLPAILILLEPDLGTVLLIILILFSMIFLAGAKGKHLLIIILLAFLAAPLLWMMIKPYQRIRISSVFLQSENLRKAAQENPRLAKILVGANFSTREWENSWGYHLIRSKYAVASGGFTGYGFRKGPFIKYGFLPFRHNDFIFAMIAQQWGFIGCILLLLLYVVIIVCGLEIARDNYDPFARLAAAGITLMFAIQVIVNISMTVGLMPITGITLPFVSYGGSSLLFSMISIGLLNNIGQRRPFSSNI